MKGPKAKESHPYSNIERNIEHVVFDSANNRHSNLGYEADFDLALASPIHKFFPEDLACNLSEFTPQISLVQLVIRVIKLVRSS